MGKVVRVVLLAVVAAGIGSVWSWSDARAQDSAGQDQERKRDPRAARKLVRDAEEAMGQGKYKVAAKLLEQAYEADPLPLHLYSTGVAYHREYQKNLDVEDGKRAVAHYRKFLASTRDRRGFEAVDAQIAVDELKDAIETIAQTSSTIETTQQQLERATARVEELETELRATTRARADAEAKTAETIEALAEMRRQRDTWQRRAMAGGSGRGALKRHGGAALMAAGGVALGFGILYGLDAARIGDRLSGGEPWSPIHDRLVRDGEVAERNMIILTSAGGAVLIGGSVLYYLGVRDSKQLGDEKIAIQPLLAPGAAMVQVGGSF